ncbi:MAG: hypothetical protein NPIRA02_27450 [Nitrospirales bacterium]|nr:MAG: hypothetical protein NPIRA02_27450 [Nitrospirales bacterium]
MTSIIRGYSKKMRDETDYRWTTFLQPNKTAGYENDKVDGLSSGEQNATKG